MSTSKRHHYIPQFYLKGFTNRQRDFFVFDKKTETIRKSNPLNSFFENHRNTSTDNDEKSTILEEIYAEFDGLTASHLDKVRKSTPDNFSFDIDTLHRMRSFIAQIYWRIPESDKEIERLIDQLSFSDAGFDIKDKTGESVATKELQEQLKNVDLFRKMYRIFIPFLTTHDKYLKTDLENWKVYFRQQPYNLTGDNPLVIKEFIDFGSLNEELFFPLSSGQMIVHTKSPKPKELSRQFVIMMDLLIIHQSTRFVCCADQEYLKMLIDNFYSVSKESDVTSQIKGGLFSHFK